MPSHALTLGYDDLVACGRLLHAGEGDELEVVIAAVERLRSGIDNKTLRRFLRARQQQQQSARSTHTAARPLRAARRRRTVRTGPRRARAPSGEDSEPEPPLDLLDLAVLALGWGRV